MRDDLGPCIVAVSVKAALDSIAFYRDKMGFTLIYDDSAIGRGGDDTMYAVVGRGQFRVGLNEHDDSGHTMEMACDQAPLAYFEELERRGAPVSDLEEMPWGATAFQVTDPDGHVLHFELG